MGDELTSLTLRLKKLCSVGTVRFVSSRSYFVVRLRKRSRLPLKYLVLLPQTRLQNVPAVGLLVVCSRLEQWTTFYCVWAADASVALGRWQQSERAVAGSCFLASFAFILLFSIEMLGRGFEM